MPLVAMVCASLLGLVDGTTPPGPADVAAEYRQASAAAGRGSADQVRLALWCEAHGLSAERARHLTLAVLADPANAAARGLAGLVARDGRWARPEAVAEAVRSDPAAAATLAEYDDRRSKTPYTADAQWELALWAEGHGLKDQARAHFTAVARLDPTRDGAWKRLGYKKHDGRWVTDAQLAASRAEAEAQKAADKAWKPRLEKWRGMLARASQRDEARAALLGVTDPRAVASIWTVFAGGDAADQAVAVQLFGQVDGGTASLALAELAIRGRTPEVRRVAVETLTLRDPRDFVGSLVRRIRTPWKYEVRPVAGPGSVGELFVEGERYNVRRIYTPPALNLTRMPRLFDAGVPLGAMGSQPGDLLGASILSEASLINQWNARGAAVGGLNNTSATLLNYEVAAARRDLQIQQRINATQQDARMAQQALEANVRAIEDTNASILALNGRVLPILERVTGQHLGDDHKAWDRWNTEHAGYAFQESTAEKPTYSEVVTLNYQTQPAHAACFAAGTPVRTVDGTKPIEQVRRGDLVLVQDTVGGGLSYQPVLTAFHNPPNMTYRVKLGDDEVSATGIHRFWKAGHGWTMARDLKPGDVLRVLGGVASVESVTPEKTEPVFNLEVAEGRSFFVGRLGVLVHDNSLVEATPDPFDASPPVGAVAAAAKGDAPR